MQKEIDRQMLAVVTGWPLEVIDRMSREDRRKTLIFRSEWQEYINSKKK